MAVNDDLIQPIQQVVVRFTPPKQGSGTKLDNLRLVRDRVGPDDFGPIGIGIGGELFGIQEVFDSHTGSVFIGAGLFTEPTRLTTLTTWVGRVAMRT